MTTCYTHVQFAFEIPYKKDRGVRVSTQTTSARKVLSIIYRGSHRTESPLDIGCCGHQGPVMTSKELIQFLSHTQQGYSSARRQEKMHSLIVAFMRNELADCRRTEHPVNTRSQRDKPIKNSAFYLRVASWIQAQKSNWKWPTWCTSCFRPLSQFN